MGKKVIQVPMDEDLLAALDRISKSSGRPRAEVIRHACARYLRDKETEEKEKAYIRGYKEMPETGEFASFQVEAAKTIFEEEPW